VKHSSACYLLHANFLLGLFFDPEVGGDMFRQTAACLSTLHGVASEKAALFREILTPTVSCLYSYVATERNLSMKVVRLRAECGCSLFSTSTMDTINMSSFCFQHVCLKS
jgi:hypothetical protein